MITRLYVDNYACLTNFELKFTPTTLLVGDNGAGKSMVLEVLRRVQALVRGGSVSALFPDTSRTRWSSQRTQTIELDAELGDNSFSYRLEVESLPLRACRIRTESLSDKDGPIITMTDGEVELRSFGKFEIGMTGSGLASFGMADASPARPFLQYVHRMLICAPLPPLMRTDAAREEAALSADASNFVAWYRALSNERQDALADLTVALRDVVDGLKGLRLVSSGHEARTLVASFKKPDRFELSFDELSDGQRMLIVLYSLLHLTADQGYSLWLDEPVNFVALKEIQPWIIALADACGGELAQAVICSHHPELIDYLGPDDGQILQRKNGGPSTVRPLRDIASKDGLRLSETLARGWEA